MSNFTILRVCSWYPNLAREFHQNQQLIDLSYDAQLQEFQRENITLPGSWSECLTELGNRATDVLFNVDSIQRRWCEENGVKVDFERDDWMFQVLRAQIKSFRPDVVFFYAGAFFEVRRPIRQALRQEFPFLKVVTGWWGDELWGNQYETEFGDLDVVFASTTAYQKFFRLAGIPAYALGSCYEHRLGQRVADQPVAGPGYDFVFAGTTGYRKNDHRQRYLDLIEIMQKTNLHIWCREPESRLPLKSYIKRPVKQVAMGILTVLTARQLAYLRERVFRKGPLANVIDLVSALKAGIPPRDDFFYKRRAVSELFPDRSHPLLLTGSDYYGLIRRSKLVFNRHRDEVADYGNIRVFEVTGLGSCLITDRGRELCEFFVPDEEIVTYDTIDECVEKVAYLLDHEEQRGEIAAKGQRRTLSEHTVMHRCVKINDILQQML